MVGMVGNNTATLMSSTAQPAMTAPKCLTFWYYMFGRNPANFSLYVNNLQTPFEGPLKLLWIKRQPQANKWVQAQVEIPVQTSLYYLMFRASLPSISQDTIALDDITYTDGECTSMSICDFEVGVPLLTFCVKILINRLLPLIHQAENGCNWISDQGTFLRESPSVSGSLYPPIDHTLGAADGHFMKVNPQVANQQVKLSYTIPKSSSGDPVAKIGPQPMCLKFWYYMGAPPGTTQTMADYYNISTPRRQSFGGTNAPTLIRFNSSNQWLYGRVDVNLAVNEMVSIVAQISSPKSTVGFDDIQIQSQACEQPGWCDFENGELFILILA